MFSIPILYLKKFFVVYFEILVGYFHLPFQASIYTAITRDFCLFPISLLCWRPNLGDRKRSVVKERAVSGEGFQSL